MSDIIKTQRSLALKAMHNPTHKFDHLYRLICQEEWIHRALALVLSNKGARTAGIDGATRETYDPPEAYLALIREIQQELREKRFRPVPVRRVPIPKANGKTRPLGIATLKDRVVQMLMKMVLEPIWESDFLNCSNGFRPGRKTMDCIAALDSYINNQSKHFWVIEGDIKGAFDNVQHDILLECLAERIADQRLLKLIKCFLKAGLMEHGLFQRTELGVPQGAICAPLLANVYLHQLDRYWWNKYGSLRPKQKEYRRKKHLGNCALIRYADDWLLLTNGSKAEAYRLRDEFQTFLQEELKLELSVEKTHITHVNNGFDFLGYHVRRYVSGHDRGVDARHAYPQSTGTLESQSEGDDGQKTVQRSTTPQIERPQRGATWMDHLLSPLQCQTNGKSTGLLGAKAALHLVEEPPSTPNEKDPLHVQAAPRRKTRQFWHSER
jgi:RNA-directed DNA polymerase